MRALLLSLAVCVVVGPAVPAGAAQPARTQVVVTLEAPSLARAVQASRVLSPDVRARRLDLRSATSRDYMARLRAAQDVVERRIRAAVPSARVRWRYSVVLNGLAVALPQRDVPKLARVAGIASVHRGGRFGATLDRSPGVIGADELWGGPTFSSAGQGVKIGVIDDGVDQSHPFFNPAGYTYPAGFPKGQRAFTTPKVIAARAFAPATTRWEHARKPFDPAESVHGTHVAGIAAGNVTAAPVEGRGRLSGTAPRAYIGNYKVLSTPSDFGLIDNAGEVIAGIEAAVRDGMDVLNMSFGELETDPARNVVDDAVDGAAAAGVVPVAAAGNSFEDLGRGSVGSPATASRAIAAAAVTKSNVLASFSSSGPTPVSLRMKPHVSAPGASILSSVPEREGMWASFSGTSMASPHVAGAAALLLQQHPGWTVDNVTSALVQTGRPVTDSDSEREAVTTRQGGGLVDLLAADEPFVFASPSTVSLGLLAAGTSRKASVAVTDAGGGAGSWNVSLNAQTPLAGVRLTAPSTVVVPGAFELVAEAQPAASEADITGFVVLRRGNVTRRIPFWLRVVRVKLGPPARVLTKQGRYEGNARNGKARVVSYRYPDDPAGFGVSNTLPGPEQVFRVRVQGSVANVGVRITRLPRGVSVTPRLVFAGNENRLVGVPALPADVNPYRGDSYGEARPVVAANRPSPGAYDVVFETRSRAAAGPFSFRVWIDDSTPPRVKLLTPTARKTLVLSVADSGSGVDPRSIDVVIDDRRAEFTLAAGRLRVPLADFSRGTHRLRLEVADFQETKNSESVVGILPNTTVFRRTFRIR
ncbi:MAG TPA: S8 family serine peptidase [Gaiellaceae bacterium]|nr:S8 family serine peptidase [Gaiellaceae bacterium]